MNPNSWLQVSSGDGVTYTLDDGRTRFYDLLQLVEYYQLNPGTLPTRYQMYKHAKNYFNISTII